MKRKTRLASDRTNLSQASPESVLRFAYWLGYEKPKGVACKCDECIRNVIEWVARKAEEL